MPRRKTRSRRTGRAARAAEAGGERGGRASERASGARGALAVCLALHVALTRRATGKITDAATRILAAVRRRSPRDYRGAVCSSGQCLFRRKRRPGRLLGRGNDRVSLERRHCIPRLPRSGQRSKSSLLPPPIPPLSLNPPRPPPAVSSGFRGSFLQSSGMLASDGRARTR